MSWLVGCVASRRNRSAHWLPGLKWRSQHPHPYSCRWVSLKFMIKRTCARDCLRKYLTALLFPETGRELLILFPYQFTVKKLVYILCALLSLAARAPWQFLRKLKIILAKYILILRGFLAVKSNYYPIQNYSFSGEISFHAKQDTTEEAMQTMSRILRYTYTFYKQFPYIIIMIFYFRNDPVFFSGSNFPEHWLHKCTF